MPPGSSSCPDTGEGPGNWLGTITFRLNPQATDDVERIGAVLKKYNPNYPSEYYTVQNIYALIFEGEQHFGQMAAFFAGLTIFISCLGLFALAAWVKSKRSCL